MFYSLTVFFFSLTVSEHGDTSCLGVLFFFFKQGLLLTTVALATIYKCKLDHDLYWTSFYVIGGATYFDFIHIRFQTRSGHACGGKCCPNSFHLFLC